MRELRRVASFHVRFFGAYIIMPTTASPTTASPTTASPPTAAIAAMKVTIVSTTTTLTTIAAEANTTTEMISQFVPVVV